MNAGRNLRRAMIFSFLAFAVWACADAGIKYVGATVSVYAMGFYNMIVIVAFMTGLGCWGRLGSLGEAVASPLWRWHALRGTVICAQFLSEMYAFTHMSLARTYTMLFTMPLLIVPLAFLFMKEKAGAAKWLAILLGFCGVLVVLRPGMIPLDLPAMVALFAALNFSIANLIARHVGRVREEKPLTSAFITQVVALLCTLPFYLAHFSMPGLHDMLIIVLIGVLIGIGFLLLTEAFACADTAIVAPFHYTQILWAILFGYTLFGDMPDKWVAAGAAIIIASGLWLIKQEHKASPENLPKKISVQGPAD